MKANNDTLGITREIRYRRISLKCSIELEPIVDLILSHHERWDGKVYAFTVCNY